jgi:hypothetical protein
MNKIVVLPEQKPVKIKPGSENEQNDIEIIQNNGSRVSTLEKEKQKRVITNTKKWRFTEEDYTPENQIGLLHLCALKNRLEPLLFADKTAPEWAASKKKDVKNIINKKPEQYDTTQLCVLQQLSQKIAGYKSQDIAKNIYSPGQFITRERVIELLIESDLKCHYCKKDIKVLYEIVRDPLQWTLDRIDNDHGHNSDNLLIACLSCNLRRKTIYHERYEMTKICNNVIKLA